MKTKQYLGDSVYASFDSGMLELTTENGLPGDPSNSIFIEPEVFNALVRYAKAVYERTEHE